MSFVGTLSAPWDDPRGDQPHPEEHENTAESYPAVLELPEPDVASIQAPASISAPATVTDPEAASPPEPIGVVAYLRVSTAGQVDGEGLDVQARAIAGWAAEQGRVVVESFVDAGRSGALAMSGRVGLLDAFNALRHKRATGLVVYRLDRLSRDAFVQEQVYRDVKAVGATLHSTSPQEEEALVVDSSDPARAMMRGILGAVAQYQRDMIVLQLAAGRRSKREKGGYAGGRPPYGWRAVEGALVEDPSEQATVAAIVGAVEAGVTLREIARGLNRGGVRQRNGNANWTHVQIGSVVAAEVRAGRCRPPASYRPGAVRADR